MPTDGAIAVRGIDHIVLRVAGPEAMIAFYGTVPGCPVVRRQDAPRSPRRVDALRCLFDQTQRPDPPVE